MNTMRAALIAIAGIAAFSGPPAIASTPPDYIGFSEKVDRFAFAVASGTSCKHFGYRASEQALRDEGQRIMDEAVLAGMPAGNAQEILVAALRAETAREDDRVKRLSERKADPAAKDEFLNY